MCGSVTRPSRSGSTRRCTALRPVLAGARVDVEGGPNRPPLTRDRVRRAVRPRGRRSPAELGLPALTGVAVGGASDGNFTAGVGTPTLDGLGAVGGGAHADDEHVLVDELPGRTALLVALMNDVLPVQADRRPIMTNVREVRSMESLTDQRSPRDAGTTGDTAARAALVADTAALAAGVSVREVAELGEFEAVCQLFDRIWRPEPQNPPITAELLRALTKADNYVGRRL